MCFSMLSQQHAVIDIIPVTYECSASLCAELAHLDMLVSYKEAPLKKKIMTTHTIHVKSVGISMILWSTTLLLQQQ